MILDALDNLALYRGVHPLLADIAAFLAASAPAELPPGEHDLGGGLRCIAATGETVAAWDGRMERHRAHVDVHVPILGTEIFGYRPIDACDHGAYDDEADAEMLTAESADLLTVSPRQFILFNPDDAHRSMLHREGGPVFVRKLVFKLPAVTPSAGTTGR